MDTRRYAAFIAAAETSSMSGAAKRLGYTPSGIVRLVNALEADVGFALLTRTSTGVSLTPEGAKILPILKEVLRYEEQAEQASARIRGLAEGSLVVGVQAGVTPAWLSDALKAYGDAYSAIAMTVVERPREELVRMLENREADCCLLHGRADGCTWTSLALRELVVWLPPESALASNAALMLAEVADCPLVRIPAVQDSFADDVFESRGLVANAPYEASGYGSAWSMVQAGLGCALCLDGAEELFAGAVELRPLSPRRFTEFGACVLEGPMLAPAAEEFVAFVASFASKMPQLVKDE